MFRADVVVVEFPGLFLREGENPPCAFREFFKSACHGLLRSPVQTGIRVRAVRCYSSTCRRLSPSLRLSGSILSTLTRLVSPSLMISRGWLMWVVSHFRDVYKAFYITLLQPCKCAKYCEACDGGIDDLSLAVCLDLNKPGIGLGASEAE